MAEGDSFWGFLKDTVNSVPVLGAYTSAAWGPGNWDPNAAPTKDIFSSDASAMERIGSVINAVPFLHVTGDAVGAAADNFAPLKFVLDFGNRTADSFFNAAQAEDDSDVNTSFFDGWKQGWDSWGTDEHVTAGQIVGASLSNGLSPTGISTFTPQGVKETQDLAHKTWYGDLAGAATDISAGFLGVPVVAPLKAARAGKTISTLADAEAATEAFNTGQRVGKTGALFKPSSPQAQATRIEELARTTFDKSESLVDAMNFTGSLTSHMGGRGSRALAEIFTEARKLGRDMGEHVIGNTYLAAMGSEGARAELMASAPLLASKLANATLAPQVFDNAAKAHELLVQAYKADPSSVKLDEIVTRVYDTPRKQAEQAALQSALDRAKDEALKAKDLRGRMAALRPRNRMQVNGQSFDLNADNLTIKEARVKAESQYKDLQGQLAEAKAEMKAALASAGAGRRGSEAAVRDAMNSAEGIGAAKGIATEQAYARQGANLDVAAAGRGVQDARVQRNWVEAEYRSAKTAIRKMGDAAGDATKARFSTLAAELESAKSAQDAARLESVRAKAVAEARRTDIKTVDRKAMLAAAESIAKEAKQAAFDAGSVANEAHSALGAARQKVDDLTARLAEAKSDHELLRSTPLDENGYTLPQWRKDMTNARGNAKLARRKEDMLTALNRTAKRELAADAKAARDLAPGLSATHQWLADIDALGRGENLLPSLRTAPSMLDQAKTWYRENIGASYLYDAGDLNSRVIFHVLPKKWAATIGTPYGRSAINTLDRYVGMQELGSYLKASKAYSGDEIKNITEEFLRQRPGASGVGAYIESVHKDMLERIVQRVAPDLSDADVKKATESLAKGMSSSRGYMASALQKAEAEGSQWASLREFPDADASDAIHQLPVAMLRPHLMDTAPFADPVMLEKALKKFQQQGGIMRALPDVALGTMDWALAGWKLAQLMRPGLMVRNMLDSNVRAYALMGTVPTVMSAMNGAFHFAKNNGLRVGDYVTARKAGVPALRAIGAQDPAGFVRQVMNSTDVQIGGGKTASVSLYGMLENGNADAAGIAQARQAMTKGTSPSQGLLQAASRDASRFRENAQEWSIYRADSKEWPRAYSQHAQVLAASPTAKKIMEMDGMAGIQAGDLPNFTKELFSDPAVRDEYRLLLDSHDMTPEMFVEQVIRETDLMFPEPGMAADILSGRFQGAAGKRWIESHFPKDQRFDVPGNESVFEHSARVSERGRHAGREITNKVFAAIQDNPDFWLARHPVAVNAFKKQVKVESQKLLESRVRRLGPDAEITADDLAKIEQRARNHAIGTVRDYMYDATRNSGADASALMHRLVPFFAPFADTMRAYSRLIYDDPSRLAKIAGMYNAPFNANTWADNPFIVDQYGNRLERGSEPDGGAFIVIGGDYKQAGGKSVAVNGKLRLRASSFNTILQGDVPWLPGWGPAVQIPVNVALNNNKELALSLSNSDNPAVQTLMKSLFQDGEVPVTDESTLWKTLAPSWLRRFADAKDGVTYGRNVAYLMNAKYMEAQSTGQPFNYQQALKDAQAEATGAAFPLLVSQFGFGISGDAMVQGQFYVQKMHEFQAMDEPGPNGAPSVLETLYGKGITPTAVFAQQFPEASGLSWSFTRNKTGINATVTAQSSALKNQALISENPDLGWFILGSDNVGGEFSSTAYNQQKMAGSRTQLSNEEIAQQAQVSMGWDSFQKMMTSLSNYQVAYGLSDDMVDAAKKAIVQAIGQTNTSWYAEYNDRLNKVQDFYQKADLLAADPRLANRQDIAMYATYRDAQKQVLDTLGLSSFAGTSQKSALARAAMMQIGSKMARENIGFQQMWERMLYNDVKPKASDGKYGLVDSAGTSANPGFSAADAG